MSSSARKARSHARARPARAAHPGRAWARSLAAARSPRASAARVASRFTNPESSILTWYSEHIASQNRGGAIMTWGPISRRSSRAVSGSSGKFTVAPTWSAIATLMSCSPTQAKGRNETISSPSRIGSTSVTPAAIASRLRWLIIAALAVPVVPDV